MNSRFHGHLLLFVAAVSVSGPLYADWKTDIEFDRLVEKYGPDLPDGSGLRIGIVESDHSGSYAVDADFPGLQEQEVTYLYDTPSAFSGHANQVARRLVGIESIIPGPKIVGSISSANWLARVLESKRDEPLDLGYDIYNHSWISSQATDFLSKFSRLDYVIDQYDAFMAGGLDNFYNSIPLYTGQNFNNVVVGVSSGRHSIGDTIDGRTKPDIVAPEQSTSYGTPLVDAVAGLLISKIQQTEPLSFARKTECLKAIILAGATKEEFPQWEQTATRPLDPDFGAGELNAFNAFEILVAGRRPSSLANIGGMGWDYAEIGGGDSRIYLLDGTDGGIAELSAILTWHRKVSPSSGDWTLLESKLENLDLHLWRSNASGSLVEKLWSSQSQLDNVEHAYQRNLPSGWYALQVVSQTDAADYAIAWRSNIAAAELPGSSESVAVSLTGLSAGQEITIHSSHAVTVSQSGASSAIKKVELLESGSLMATDTSLPAHFEWTALELGTRNLKARVTTELGTYAASVQVTVLESPPSPPTELKITVSAY